MTQDERILKSIMARIDQYPYDIQAYEDAFSCIRNIGGDGIEIDRTHQLRQKLNSVRIIGDDRFTIGRYELTNKMLYYTAPVVFDDYLLALESHRKPEEQFWLPRRRKLMKVCQALQDMEDGNLDELFLSMPARVGKSSLVMFFLTWIMGKDSERSNLYCSYTDSVVGALYSGLIEILTDTFTYTFYDIFPLAKIANTNAKDLLLNLGRRKRYASFTGRSLYGTLNGACDCNGYLIADDLISGDAEARSKDRLNTAWNQVDNNMIPRAKEHAKILWIGTRWSLVDPQGRRIDLLENDEKYRDRRWKVFNTPALNEKDESNFVYDFGVGFSTEYYQQRRASFERNSDMASFFAQYQGEPIERDGAVFDPDELRYYNGVLPDGQPDRIFMAIDPAWGGGDFVAAPVCFQFGDDVYVQDVVFDDSDKKITQPEIAAMIKKYGVQAVKVEGTKMTASYGEDIDKLLRDDGYKVNMMINTSHFTGQGKRNRIFDKAPDIRDRFLFLADGHRSKQYSQFMQNLFSFTVTGKAAKHDDAPDALAMAAEFIDGSSRRVEIIARPF